MNITRQIGTNSSKKNDGVVKQLFDLKTLDFYCRYIISQNQNIRISSLNLVNDLFKKIDPLLYNGDIERLNRIEFVKRGLEARIGKRLSDRDMIIQYINGGPLDKPLLDVSELREISDEELAYLNEQTSELTKSYFVDEKYDDIMRLGNDLHNSNYTRRADVVHEIQRLASDLNSEFKKMDSSIAPSTEFSMVPEIYERSMGDIYSQATSPSRVLRTGMVGLNMMLDGGFQAGRVYMLFGIAAGGKSFTLTDIAMQIKKYNKDYITHDPTKRPCVVILTMENSVQENVERMFEMTTGHKINEYDNYKESMDALELYGLKLTEDDPIDIHMIYKPNLSVDTDFLYTIVDNLRDIGEEPICIIQDHIKRIRPVHKSHDLRLDLGEVVNEFKAFANETGIPVITDSHLNREAAKNVLDASAKNKKDLIRVLGSYNVSESMLMIDNTDVGIIITRDMDELQNSYMGFLQIKTRTRCDLEAFYQPYIPGSMIKLVEDVGAAVPCFRRNLREEPKMKGTSGSDYAPDLPKASRRRQPDDDEELFSSLVMGDIEDYASSSAADDILLADNMNQSKFVVAGQPSQPAFPIHQESPVLSPIVIEQDITPWEQELIWRKYNTDAKTVLAFFDDKGMVINDGLEDLV